MVLRTTKENSFRLTPKLGQAQRGLLHVPTLLAVEDGVLVWSPLYKQVRYRGPSLLEDFRTLWKASDAEIERFALRRGVLGVDESGNPKQRHERFQYRLRAESIPAKLLELSTPEHDISLHPFFSESLYWWRRYSEASDAVLSAAVSVRQGTIPDDTVLWRFYFQGNEIAKGLDWYAKLIRWPLVSAAALLIQCEVNSWLRCGGTSPD